MAFQLGDALLHGPVALREAYLFLQLQDDSLAPLDGVPHALAGNAEVIGDLSQRQIVVVILLHHIALLFGEHVAVEIQQQRNLKILCHRKRLLAGVPGPVKCFAFS